MLIHITASEERQTDFGWISCHTLSRMQKSNETSKKFLNLKAETSQLSSQRKTMKQQSKSLGDLPNLKREIDDRLKGKLPKSSPRWREIRKLGETKIPLEIDDLETSLITRNRVCFLQPNIKIDDSSFEHRESYSPPLSQDVQRLRDIVRENTKSANFNSMRQKTLKVDDIVHTASKLEAEYLQRTKSPVYLGKCIHRGPYGNRCVCEGITCNSEKSKSNSRLKTRTLVVKIPGISDNLNDYDCKGGPGAKSNFSYRHKR